jgi:hypothetical protein
LNCLITFAGFPPAKTSGGTLLGEITPIFLHFSALRHRVNDFFPNLNTKFEPKLDLRLTGDVCFVVFLRNYVSCSLVAKSLSRFRNHFLKIVLGGIAGAVQNVNGGVFVLFAAVCTQGVEKL